MLESIQSTTPKSTQSNSAEPLWNQLAQPTRLNRCNTPIIILRCIHKLIHVKEHENITKRILYTQWHLHRVSAGIEQNLDGWMLSYFQ